MFGSTASFGGVGLSSLDVSVTRGGGGGCLMFRFGWSRALVALLVAVLFAVGLGVVDSGRVVAQSTPPDPVSAPVVNADGTVTVPFWWSLNPAGSRAGDKFRLLFATSTTRNAVPTNIDVYNQFVQARAAAGHPAIQGHSSEFRVVGSSRTVDARVNARLRSSDDVVAPVYWLNGPRISRDYSNTAGQGFWSSAWENSLSSSHVRDERGRSFGNGTNQFNLAAPLVWTGTNTDGTKARQPFGGRDQFQNAVRFGNFATHPNPISGGSGSNVAGTFLYSLYGISPVYVIAANAYDCDDGDGDATTLKLFETAVADSYCDFVAPAGTVWRSVDSVEVTKLELAPEVAPEAVFGDPRVVTAGMDINDTALRNERIFHDRTTFVDRSGGTPAGNPADRSNYVAYFDQPVASDTSGGYRVIDLLAGTLDSGGRPTNNVDAALMKKLAYSLVTVDLASFDGETGNETASLRFRDGPLCASAFQLGDTRAKAAVVDPDTNMETSPAVPYSPGLFPYGVFGYFWGKYEGSSVEGRTAACVQFELEVTLSPADDSTPKTIKVRVKDNQNGRHSVFSENYPKHTVQQQETSSSDAVSAQLLADVKGYAGEAFHGTEHVNRWKRVLLAFGESVSGFTGTPMTAVEAQSYVDKGWSRWDPVVTALTALEAQASTDTTDTSETETTDTETETTETETTSESGYVVPASLVANVQGYAAETGNGAAHVNRWKRVLLAFGETVPGFTGTPMTISEAQGFANQFWSVRWDPVVAALTALETNQQQQQSQKQQQDPTPVDPTPPPTPEISITAGNTVTEGGSAVFTLSASPAPSTALQVNANVTASGAYGVTTGSQTVTIGTSGTATFTVATTGDSTDEPDGSVTVTLATGSGYDLDSSASSATVNISDDDNPPPPPTPEISITAGSNVTEGGSASFTLSASPVPSAALQVNANVTASGDYGVTTGSQTVTIGTSGTATFTVATTGDSIDEPDGSVTVTLTAGSGYTLDSSASAATVTVSDDDNPPPPSPPPPPANTVTISVEESTYVEGRSPFYLVRFRLSKPASEQVTVKYTPKALGTGSGYATAGEDFVLRTSSITFRPGVTFNIGLIWALNDRVKEPDETFTIVLSEPTGGVHISDKQPVLTIKDND